MSSISTDGKKSMPKRLFVIEDEVEQATHIGHEKLREIVISTDEPTLVGEYRLVKSGYFKSCEVVKAVRKKGTQ